jgi:Xaa-Pro dipeptidase
VHEPPFLTKGDATVVQRGHDLHGRALDLPGPAFSARVEDCIVVRPGGGEALTSGWQDLTVIE